MVWRPVSGHHWPERTEVYDAAIALGVKGEGSIDENLDSGTKEPLTLKTVGNKILNYLSKTMVMTIPIIMGAAMFRTIAVVCGDGMLGIWSADSDIYNFFYNWIYNAGYYFLPVYLVGLLRSSLAAASHSA